MVIIRRLNILFAKVFIALTHLNKERVDNKTITNISLLFHAFLKSRVQ